MGAGPKIIYSLADASTVDESVVGGKAAKLGRLIAAGYRVPPGFCVSVHGYARFFEKADLAATIRMELGRKLLSSMRWEEIWDAALRIRTAFMTAEIPDETADVIKEAFANLDARLVAVRSSAPGEDSASQSHAGLHESVLGVTDERGLLDAVRVVWASLWSDAALLYRRELDLDPQGSRMAVVIQAFVTAAPSGVGFGMDPREPGADLQVVEAVPGPCDDLVSGRVDPDRWILKRSTGELVEWRPGQRSEYKSVPLLDRPDVEVLHRTLYSLEEMFGWVPDVEWTGKSDTLTLLQARPVTQPAERDDERTWYLTLRPGRAQLSELCDRVTEELIPALEAEASRFSAQSLELLTDTQLSGAIYKRLEALEKWQKIYRDEFIPFAHGVRQLGLYYNDAVRPEDPYEFIGILRSQGMIAVERNAALEKLALAVRRQPILRKSLEQLGQTPQAGEREHWRGLARKSAATGSAREFYREFDAFLHKYMNIVYDDQSLGERPDLILQNILELAREEPRHKIDPADAPQTLEKRLFEAIGPGREQEASDVIRIGRLSWRLRDDDNVLMGRLENQLRQATDIGVARLLERGSVSRGTRVPVSAAKMVADALRDPDRADVSLPHENVEDTQPAQEESGVTPRQLIGQPAAPGIATGLARIVRQASDIGEFKKGEILVCDAIQPTMTHLVPLSGAVVERRGGMLIHGAIIARELGVPCVNGVVGVTKQLTNGELLTVDGYLGIVTVGPPEFDMELKTS